LVEVIELAVAHWDNIFRGAFHDETDNIVIESISDSHSLAVRAEGDPEHELPLIFALDELLLHVLTIVGQKLKEADFDGATDGLVLVTLHLHVSVAVQDNAVPEHVLDLEVASNVIGLMGVVSKVNASNFHVACGECGRFASKDVDDLARGFEGVQVLDEQVLLLERVD
jgi:hypothetical protein